MVSDRELGTVLSIQENPFPIPNEFTEEQKRNALKVIRRNISLVFSGLSVHNRSGEQSNPLMTSHVRPFLDGVGKSVVQPEESPSLLFYYLFDDWATSYSLVIRREHSYSAALDKIVSNY